MDDFAFTSAGATAPQGRVGGTRPPAADLAGFLLAFTPVADGGQEHEPVNLTYFPEFLQVIDPLPDRGLADRPGAFSDGSPALAQAGFQPVEVPIRPVVGPMGWSPPDAGPEPEPADPFSGLTGLLHPGPNPVRLVTVQDANPIVQGENAPGDMVGLPPAAGRPVGSDVEREPAGPMPDVHIEAPPIPAFGIASLPMPAGPLGGRAAPAALGVDPSPVAPAITPWDASTHRAVGRARPDPEEKSVLPAILAPQATAMAQGQALVVDDQTLTPAVAAPAKASPIQDAIPPPRPGARLDPGPVIPVPAPDPGASPASQVLGADQTALRRVTPKGWVAGREGPFFPVTAELPGPVPAGSGPPMSSLAHDDLGQPTPARDRSGATEPAPRMGAIAPAVDPRPAQSSGVGVPVTLADHSKAKGPETGDLVARLLPPSNPVESALAAGGRTSPVNPALDASAAPRLAAPSAPVDVPSIGDLWPRPAGDGGVSPLLTSDRPASGVQAPPPATQVLQALIDPGRDRAVPLDLALDPPELGRLRLSFSEINGTLTLVIAAERPETADLMRRHLGLLVQEFARAGIDAPLVSISNGGADGRQDPRLAMPMPHAPGDDSPQGDQPVSPHPETSRPLTRGALDLRV